MEERLRQLQYAHRAGTNNGSMRYLPFHEVDHPPPLPPFRPPPPRPPVPLEPWDHQAILAYRNRVNANSNPDRRNLDLEQHETIFRDPHKNIILHRDRERERRSGLWVEEYHEEEEEEEAQLDRLRLSRLRDGETRRNHHHQHQEFRDWSLRQQEPHPQLFVNQHQRQHQIHVSGHSNPTPALDQKLFRLGLEKRVRQDEEDELEEFQRRKRPKYQGFGIGNDTQFLYSPPRVQLPWQSAQVRGRVNHDSFEADELTLSRLSVGGDRDSHLPRFREVQNSIGLNQHHHHHNGYTPIRVVDEDKEQMQRGSGFPKHLVEHRQAPQSLELFGKDQLLPSSSPVSKGMGLQQKQHWEARKGKQKVQSKGKNEGIVNKQKNKIPQWVGKTNGKLRKSGLQLHSDSYSHALPIAGLALSTQGKTASQNELLETSSQEQSNISESGKWSKLDSAKYERSADTLDLSVVFKPSGMIAQEVVTSADNNWPDRTRTNSSGSKGLIQDHSFLEEDVEEEGEIRSVESEATLFQNKSLEDNHNAGSRSKPMSTTPISETVSSEEPSCYLDDLDNKAKRRSAMQSLEKVATLEKHPSLDRKDNGSPTTVKPNQSEEGPATAEYLGASTPLLMLDNNLCVSAPFELKLSSGEMQEVCSQDTYLAPSNCKIIDASDLEETQKNKLKANQLEKPSLNDSEKMGSRLLTSSELHSSTEVIEQQWPDTKGQHLPNRTLRSNATQQLSGSYQIQNLQPDTTSSVKSIGVSTLPHSRQSVGSIPNKASSGSAARSRTWHRTDNATSSSVLVRPFVFHNGATSAGQAGSKVESTHPAAYVRKGNSLVRAPFSIKSSLAGPLNTTSKASTQIASSLKSVPARRDPNNVIIGNVGSNSTSITTAFRFSTPAVERPSTPPIAQTCKSSVCITGSLSTSVPADVSGTSTAVVVTTSAPSGNDCKANTKNISMDNQVMGDPSNSLPQSKTNLNEDSLETAGTVQMIYVKRKSNQLVAAPTSKSKSSTASLGEGGPLPSDCFVQDHYYKRKKNQLVRSSLSMDNKIPKGLEFPGVSSSVNMELNVPSLKGQRGMAFFRTKLGRVLKQKKHSTLQSKWVWTHGKVESSSLPFLQSRRVAPLFPWKRPSYGSSGLVGKLKAIPSISKRAPFSLISKKLNRLRKRDTVYTKSLNGYSLRRSGVLSLGGSNLKWTKSIEKRSKQANEEATIAVAAAEKRKREAQDSKGKEEKWTSKQARGIKLRGSKSREPSAEDSFSSFNTSLGSRPIDSAKLSSQRRVSIGDNDYLKVGNGNKLVRDPKKVCRVLASEKVRWSLHTARHRLAKRQQYCQFFTRFGKCNKEDGKCPYIHDREKVAVCTKFLKGACSNDKCELTHKIIPERMEDCSYFLQGLCTNENCPYRHVNVNPKAAVCDGFLKGYCAEGDKCNKKHTYICPQYAAMGECPERSNCKLHHPKKKDKPKASKRCKGGINVKRRYFVQEDFSISELASTFFRLHSELHPKQQINLAEPSKVPECLEFISLDTPEEDTNDNALIHGDISSVKLTKSEFLSNLGLPADDIDMMIKPVRLLWKDQAVNSTID